MTALWTSTEAEAATLGHANHAFEALGLSIDTRSLKPGDLFVALKGDARDGHAFLRAAFDAKAAAALVARPANDVSPRAPLLTVANTQRALEDLARAARARSRAKIVAVTGSVGKTTTKEILRLALGALGTTSASTASYNNHWGVPLSLALLPREVRFGVFEIGMNHFGEIRALVNLVRPDVALVTAIAPAHLEFFENCEAIADAKSEIFDGVVPGGYAIIPSDSSYTERLAARARQAGLHRLLRFGEKGASDARLLSFRELDEGSLIEADILGQKYAFRAGAPGRHIAHNTLAALLAVAALEGDVNAAAASLAGFAPLKGRGSRFQANLAVGHAQIIDESYNANPVSMRAALALLRSSLPAQGGRRIAILGDMLELGTEAFALHASLSQDIEAARADLMFLCGPHMRALWDVLPPSRRGGYGETSTEIAPEIVAALRDGDVALVKGSFGSRMAVIIEALKASTVGG
jgi:UDP-N-acetylmuramoyl-tripeptide--D-alanyl-D-alanine ligase